MLISRLVLALTTAAALASCVSPTTPAETILATVGDAEVTASEVRARLSSEDTGPPVVRPGADQPDPWRDALRLAIRDELLSLEAVARDPGASWAPDPAGRAARIRAVINQERAQTPLLQASSIADAQARSWLAGNHELFDLVEGARVTWAMFGHAGRAREVLDAASGKDEAAFRMLAGHHGAMTGTATLDSSGNGADTLVARVAFAVREAGALGMTTLGERSWVVRVNDIQVVTPPWNDGLADRVRTAMAWEREQAHLDALAERLKSRWPVSIDEGQLAASRP